MGKCYHPAATAGPISRLRKRNEVPEQPKENIPVSGVNSAHYLDISRENEIAGNLVFLSATSDDRLKVMAVFIEKVKLVMKSTLLILPKLR